MVWINSGKALQCAFIPYPTLMMPSGTFVALLDRPHGNFKFYNINAVFRGNPRSGTSTQDTLSPAIAPSTKRYCTLLFPFSCLPSVYSDVLVSHRGSTSISDRFSTCYSLVKCWIKHFNRKEVFRTLYRANTGFIRTVTIWKRIFPPNAVPETSHQSSLEVLELLVDRACLHRQQTYVIYQHLLKQTFSSWKHYISNAARAHLSQPQYVLSMKRLAVVDEVLIELSKWDMKWDAIKGLSGRSQNSLSLSFVQRLGAWLQQ